MKIIKDISNKTEQFEKSFFMKEYKIIKAKISKSVSTRVCVNWLEKLEVFNTQKETLVIIIELIFFF